MRTFATAAMLGLLALAVACEQKPETTPRPSSTLKDAPSWVELPAIPNGIAETGYAKANLMGDRGLQTQTALADGRRKLAEQMKVRVQAMFSQLNQQLTRTSANSNGEAIRSEVMERLVDNVTRNLVDQELQGSTRRAIWMDENGDMYLHVVLPKEVVHTALRMQASQEIRREIQQGDASLELALDKLDAAIAAIK